jgi:hypothetical protein
MVKHWLMQQRLLGMHSHGGEHMSPPTTGQSAPGKPETVLIPVRRAVDEIAPEASADSRPAET